MVFFVSGQTFDFIALEVVDWRLKYTLHLGSGLLSLVSPAELYAGQIVTVKLIRERRLVSLVVDGVVVSSEMAPEGNTLINVGNRFFLGGGVETCETEVRSKYNLPLDSFNGCIYSVSINGEHKDYLDPTISTCHLLDQCQDNPCLSKPCLHNGVCELQGGDFICHCLPGRSGDICQVIEDPCVSSPCLYGGTCVAANNSQGFSCECTELFTGSVCEDVLFTSQDSLEYVATSYTAWNITPKEVLLDTNLTFYVYPHGQPYSNGILLYINGSSGAYFAVAIEDSVLKVVSNLCCGPDVITMRDPLVQNTFSKITITRSGTIITLSVPGLRSVNGIVPVLEDFRRDFTAHETLYVGGLVSPGAYADLPVFFEGFENGFFGCISDVHLNGEVLDDLVEMHNIHECRIDYCSSYPCHNGGECTSRGFGLVCHCLPDFTGEFCEHSIYDSCAANAHRCDEGSTCIYNDAEMTYECLCPIFKGGQYCNESIHRSPH